MIEAQVPVFWRADRSTMRVEKMRRAEDYNDMGRFKTYITESRKYVHLEDYAVFHNPRDAAISLTAYLIAKAKVRSTELQTIMDAAEKLMAEHDITECPYLAPIQVV